ncbi:MAG: pyridoxal-phosphate dependent enzyme [Flavobacteriales bacterium]|nr:pyridoxal-phosphate dependent enzyme [Flavobacteriales bacterium]
MSAQAFVGGNTRWDAYQRILELEHLVGRTPLFPIQRLFVKQGVEVLVKLEWQQFGGSVKARAAYNIIRRAIEKGELSDGKRLLDASSGNTAIAYAVFSAVAGIPLTLCVPENISDYKRHYLNQLGVDLVFTSRLEGTDGAQYAAAELNDKFPGKYFYADQYNNDNNWKAHVQSTAPEIWEQTDGRITHFVCGLGTTGTFSGTGTGLKQINSDIKLISCQPDAPMHGLEGWKHLETAKVPGIYKSTLADEEMSISTTAAFELIPLAAKHEGLLLSPSSAANLYAAIKVAESIEKGVVVTVLPDENKSISKSAV